MLIHHSVEDFAQWKPIFDEHANARARNGSKAYRLFRKTGHPNELFILFDWENEDRARAFSRSEDLREAMQRAGVLSQPEIYFLEEIENRKEGREDERLSRSA